MTLTEKATFAAGCFWQVEFEFSKLPGVIKSTSGYTGGKSKNPTYLKVSAHLTNHAEAVQVLFDPKKITYKKLLNKFWEIHNPTTKNRQGFDIGSQYRSAIFYHSPEQKSQAEKTELKHQKTLKREIVTEIVKASKFHKAEEYHQKYLEKQGRTTC